MSAQQCTQCAAGSYSLGSGVRFDQWDAMPAGFSSLATSLESGPRGDAGLSCNRSAGQEWEKNKHINQTTKTITAVLFLFFPPARVARPGCPRGTT